MAKKEITLNPKKPAAVSKKNRPLAYDPTPLSSFKAELDPERRLYLVRDKFRENLSFRRCSGEEIFRNECGDPSGAEYWRGWSDKPSLTVVDFTELIAIHRAIEYGDKNPLGKDPLIYRKEVFKTLIRFGENIAPEAYEDGAILTQILIQREYKERWKAVILALKEAAEMKALKFEGDIDGLLEIKDSEICWEATFKFIEANIKKMSLSQVKLYPRETLAWFADCPERAVLLPESLRLWWATQSTPAAIDQSPQKEFISSIKNEVFQIIHKGFDPVIEDNQQKRIKLQKKEREIERLIPHAKRGKKVLQGAKESAKSKNEIYRTINPLYQREAENIWSQYPDLPKSHVAGKLANKINALIKLVENEDKWDEKNPLSEIAILLSDNNLKANPHTIRRIIKKPPQKTRT